MIAIQFENLSGSIWETNGGLGQFMNGLFDLFLPKN